MAEHRPAHVAHGHGAVGGDRADLEPVEPGDGGLLDPVAEEGAFGWLPLQLAEARVSPKAIPPILKKPQTPIPIGAGQLAVAPAAAHRFPFLFRLEPRPAGQAGKVLQQHIQRCLGWCAVFHQPCRQSPPHGAHLQQFEGVGGQKQHFAAPPRPVG